MNTEHQYMIPTFPWKDDDPFQRVLISIGGQLLC